MSHVQNLTGKRKRAHVSYAEDNDELDMLLFGDIEKDVAKENDADDDDEEPMMDDDAEYGKKASWKTIAMRRRAKRIKRTSISKHKLYAKPFPFLRLPLELRYMIYGYALTDEAVGLYAKTKSYRRTVTRHGYELEKQDRHDSVTEEGVWKVKGRVLNPFAPSLLAVNKQIHDESVVFLYGQPFVFQDLYALHSFLATIGPRNCSRLSDMTVKSWGYGRGVHKALNFCAFAMLASCTNLKALFIDAPIGHGRESKTVARNVYRNAHHFMEAYGSAKGRKDAAVDIITLAQENFRQWRNGQYVEVEELKQEYCEELRTLLGA